MNPKIVELLRGVYLINVGCNLKKNPTTNYDNEVHLIIVKKCLAVIWPRYTSLPYAMSLFILVT